MAYVNSTRSTANGLGDRVFSLVRTLRESLERRSVYRRTLRELSALSNRELADLGLHRSMLTRVALEAAYGK
jgi:uncharacterized protein YjiS (DUF1127 family)